MVLDSAVAFVAGEPGPDAMPRRCVGTGTAGVLLFMMGLVLGSSAVAGVEPAGSAAVSAEPEVSTPPPYAPYEFLIGEWDVGPIGGTAAAVSRFRWGPTKTYIWYSGAYLAADGERPAWEGLLVWNGVRKALDFLLVLDPASGSLVQEQGTVHIGQDGTVMREITAFYSEGNAVPPGWDETAGPGGASAKFRQTFTPDGPDRILTSVMRKSEAGWVPNFPGSDHLVMTRRKP